MTTERHHFGSAETERKLSCLRQYLSAYSIALKQQNFSRIYIDAFAGTGSRTETRAVLPIIEDVDGAVTEITTPGSACIALETSPEFHSIVLIEQDKNRFIALKKFISEYGTRRVVPRNGDANEIVQRICRKYDWKREKIRGVIFLDPYGMEVSWETVTAIANTEALDCWYFFPLSGLYRNAPKDPLQLDESKIRALNRVFGTDAWRKDWYRQPDTPIQTDMFSDVTVAEQRTASVDGIEEWVHNHLKSVFKGTVLKPMRLNHANGAPMASLFFAVSNPSKAAIKLATEIAGHILKVGISSQTRPR